MDYAKAFHLVARTSKKAAVPCVLIGGFAINFCKELCLKYGNNEIYQIIRKNCGK